MSKTVSRSSSAWDRRSSRVLAAVGLFASFTACTSEPLTLRGQLCATRGCAPGCEELEVSACDINDPVCRELVFQSVRCVRGGRLMHSPDTIVQPSLDAEPDSTSESDEPPPAGELTRLAAVDTALSLLRLQGQDVTYQAAVVEANMGVVARFDPENQQVTVQQDEHSIEWLSMLTLAHEYTHSLQDAEESLTAMLERYGHTAVTRQGVRAFIEGEAELYALLSYAFMKRADIQQWDVEGYARWMLKNSLLGVAQAQSPWYLAAATLHYPVGLHVLWGLWQTQGHVGVRHLGDRLSARFGGWVDGMLQMSGSTSGLQCGAPKLTDSFTWIANDELGPSAVFAFAVSQLDSELGVPLEPAWELAKAVRGDQLRLYAESDPLVPTTSDEPFANLRPDGNVVAEWAVAFETDERAAEFAAAAGSEFAVQRSGAQVVVSVARTPDTLSRPLSKCSLR
jgi:hypothetical protein